MAAPVAVVGGGAIFPLWASPPQSLLGCPGGKGCHSKVAGTAIKCIYSEWNPNETKRCHPRIGWGNVCWGKKTSRRATLKTIKAETDTTIKSAFVCLRTVCLTIPLVGKRLSRKMCPFVVILNWEWGKVVLGQEKMGFCQTGVEMSELDNLESR